MRVLEKFWSEAELCESTPTRGKGGIGHQYIDANVGWNKEQKEVGRDNSIMDSAQLKHALDKINSIQANLLAAKSILAVIAADPEVTRMGPSVSLADSSGSLHVFDPQTITWPPTLFLRAEFERQPHNKDGYFPPYEALDTREEALGVLRSYVDQVDQALELADDAKRLQRRVISRLSARLGFGPSIPQMEASALRLYALIFSPEFEALDLKAAAIIGRGLRAQNAQRNGVALFEGAHGIDPYYVSAARKYLLDNLGLSGAQLDTLDRKYVVPAHELVKAIQQHPYSINKLRAEAKQYMNQIAVDKANALVCAMPIEKLKEVTNDRLRFHGLDNIGVRTVADVLEQPAEHLMQVPGVGQQTALRMKAAAQTLFAEASAVPVKTIGEAKDAATLSLLNTLATYGSVHQISQDQAERRDRLISYFSAFPNQLSSTGGPFLVIKVGEGYFDQFVEDIAWAQATPSTFLPRNLVDLPTDLWADYKERPAHYQALLGDLVNSGGLGRGGEYEFGLDEDTLAAIRSLTLDLSAMKDIHLRGYQNFGAKYCLVQKKVILGDEMGLGKTVQVLAAAAHISATYAQKEFEHYLEGVGLGNEGGEQNLAPASKLNKLDHSYSDATDDLSRIKQVHAPVDAPIIVIVPASLIVNWKREVEKFTTLNVHVAHGDAKDDAISLWQEHGGVLIVTYDGARTANLGASSLLIIDEAHMIKNPNALRSKAASRLIGLAQRAILVTGTPLENHVREFSQLVSYLNPGLLRDEKLRPSQFRNAIAPVYLRRNQDDVLDELPDKLEHLEWVDLSSEDKKNYAVAIRSRNWMQARRAAMAAPTPLSAKIERIREIVQEATEDGRSILIFSYFRDVLERLHEEFRPQCVGIMNGDVAPAKRQHLVDRLGESGNVLLAQIGAGGVGLNIQKASVVILAEVQVKPTVEDQAIARAHRLGQVSAVNVYRMIGEETVDERLLEITSQKRRVFDSFARESDAAEVPDAIDISESALARQIIEAERARLGFDSDAE